MYQQTYTLNIGLARNDAPTLLDVSNVIKTLYKHGIVVLDHRVKDSSTEPTLVAKCKYVRTRGLWPVENEFFTVSVELAQDCIAVYDDNAQAGVLIGPKADKWGVFDPDYFISF